MLTNLIFFFFDGASAEATPEPAPVQENFSGGWEFLKPRRRTRREIQADRERFGVLPPEQEEKAEEAVQFAVKAAEKLAKAKPETQAASDALRDQMQAEALFIAVYQSVYPKLEEARLQELFRQQLYDEEAEAILMAFSV